MTDPKIGPCDVTRRRLGDAPAGNAHDRRRARRQHGQHTDVRVAGCPLCDAAATTAAATVDQQVRQLGHPTARRRTR